jgi:hypothetical protein
MKNYHLKIVYEDSMTKILILLITVITFFNQFFPDYLGYKRIEAISFMTDDGWCSPRTEGLGVHCFGDYYYPFSFLDSPNPWRGQPNPYNAGSLIMYEIFQQISNFSSPRIALSAFILILVGCLVFPIVHLWKISHEINATEALQLLIIFLGCAPAIMAIDRGNTVLLTTPFLYLILRALIKGNAIEALSYGLVLVLIKPQFVILGLVIAVSFGAKQLLAWLISCSALVFLPFLYYYQSFPSNILDWVRQLKEFQNYGSSGTLNPVNMSLKSDLQVIVNILNVTISEDVFTYAVYVIGVVALLYLCFDFRKRSIYHQLTSILFLVILFAGTTFHYYLSTLLIPVLCFFLISKDKKSSIFIQNLKKSELQHPWISKRIQAWATTLFLIANFVPWAIPWSLFDRFDGRGWENIGINWLPGQFLTAACGLVVIFAGAPEYLRKKFQLLKS